MTDKSDSELEQEAADLRARARGLLDRDEALDAGRLELVRDRAREEVAKSSLRRVAKEIGISHTALAGFVRADSPREPYGHGKSKLLAWGEENGIIYRRSRESRPISFFVGEMLEHIEQPQRRPSQAVLDRIRVHHKTLYAAGANSPLCGAVDELLAHNPFYTLRSHHQDLSDVDRIRDVDRTFAYVCELLIDEGFKLEEPLRNLRRQLAGRRATPPIDVAVADEEVDVLIAELKRRKAADEAKQKKRRRA